MTIETEIVRRGITEVLHFTSNHGVVGMLATNELLSTSRLRDNQRLVHVAHMNSVTRVEEEEFFDKSENWIDFVSLSISEINARYFRLSSQRARNQDLFWCLLAFDPLILTHPGVHFASTNNSYEHCARGCDVDGFGALFADKIRRKASWNALRTGRSDRLATCEQAEVLYPKRIPLDFLRMVYVMSGDDHDRVASWFRQFQRPVVPVEISPAKFNGIPN